VKFTTAWAEVLTQNSILKFVTAILAFCLLAMSICSIKLALRDALIIERACYSRSLTVASTQRTEGEVEAFVREALGQRFDTDAVLVPGMMSTEEENFRKQEQEGLKSSRMTQRIIVNKVTSDKDGVTVDADRLIAVGSVRSAFVFPLSLALSSTTRNDSDPYGLVLVRVTQQRNEGKTK
jgi:hypothetical protein